MEVYKQQPVQQSFQQQSKNISTTFGTKRPVNLVSPPKVIISSSIQPQLQQPITLQPLLPSSK